MMKRLTLILVTCFTSILLVGQNMQYYWVGNTKHYVEIDSSEILVEVKSIDNAISERLKKDADVKTFRIKNEKTQQFVIQAKEKKSFLERNSLTSTQYITYPSIREAGTGAMAFITDEITVRFKDEPDLNLFSSKYDIELIEKTPYGAYLFKVLNNRQTFEIANKIKEKENVVWSNPNFVNIIYLNQVINDPLYPNQYYLNNTGQNGGTTNIDINAPEAWTATLGCNNIRVAVLDDGVDNNHEDLAGRVVPGFTAGFNNTGGVPLNHCSKGHGMNCAGIIAASHNNLGVRGVAPNSQIVPVNIFPNQPTLNNLGGASTNAEIATAINWAWRADGGNADILSNSWGGGAENNDIINEITRARTEGRNGLGAIVVFASGNSHQQFSGVNFPGNVNGVITVGAIDRNGSIWNYSSRGPEMDLVAPSGALGTIDFNTFCVTSGGDVATTDRMGNQGYDNGNYTQAFGGTSAACPQVAGVAALMLSANPNLTEAQVRTILQNTATDMGASGFDNTFGFGRLNAQAAIQAVMPITSPSIICYSSGSQFTLNNVPAGAAVTWTATPANLFTVSSGNFTGNGGNHHILLAPENSNASGSGTVTFTINTGCGNPVQVQQTFWTGPAQIQDIFYPSSTVAPNQLIPLSIVTVPGSSSGYYKAEIVRKFGGYSHTAYGNVMEFSLPMTGTYNVKVYANNACGWPQNFYPLVFFCTEGGGMFAVSPNPADNYLDIEMFDSDDKITEAETDPYQITLVDDTGTEMLKTSAQEKKKRIDTSQLKKGQYILRIQYKGEVALQRIIIDR